MYSLSISLQISERFECWEGVVFILNLSDALPVAHTW